MRMWALPMEMLANLLYPRYSLTRQTTHSQSLMSTPERPSEMPGGLPWLPFIIRPICIGVSSMCARTWKCEGKLCSAMTPDSASGSWILGSKRCYADYGTNRISTFVGGGVMAWGDISLTRKTRLVLELSQCREISRWDSVTSGNPISLQSGTELCAPRWEYSPP